MDYYDSLARKTVSDAILKVNDLLIAARTVALSYQNPEGNMCNVIKSLSIRFQVFLCRRSHGHFGDTNCITQALPKIAKNHEKASAEDFQRLLE